MKVTAFLYAFQDGKPRVIEIPDHAIPTGVTDKALCELAFQYGQNDVQPVHGCCSVSVNDVIWLDVGTPTQRAYRVLGMGFEGEL